MLEESSDYERAFNEIDLFDGMVMSTLNIQKLIEIPLSAGEGQGMELAERISTNLVRLTANISELLDMGVNPTKTLRIFHQCIQDSYIDPATSNPLMGTVQGKRTAAKDKIVKLIEKDMEDKTLLDDLKKIV